MRFEEQHLRAKALLALEEAVQLCRYGPVARTWALRFALAYLASLGGRERTPFDNLWKALASKDVMWRFAHADRALNEICWQLRIERDDEQMRRMWDRVAQARKEAS